MTCFYRLTYQSRDSKHNNWRVGIFKSFKFLLKGNNEKLELLNSFQKFIFEKQSAARPPLLRHWVDVITILQEFTAANDHIRVFPHHNFRYLFFTPSFSKPFSPISNDVICRRSLNFVRVEFVYLFVNELCNTKNNYSSYIYVFKSV